MCNFVTKLGIILDTCKTFEPKQVSHCSQQSLPDILSPVLGATKLIAINIFFSKIEGFEGKMGKSYTLKDYDPEAGEVVEYEIPMIELNNFSVRFFDDDNYWESYTSLIFAFPVLPGKPVTNLKLLFDGLSCYVMNSDGSPASFSTGGNVYIMNDSNLQFREPK